MITGMDPGGAEVSGYSPPLSLWRLVEQHVAAHELEEIKSMLGAGVVEETLELHNELEALLEIWRDCRNETEVKTHEAKQIRLPEPPGMRDRLIQEIKFFIENIKEKAQDNGSDGDHVVKNYNQKILNYAIKSESRPATCDISSRPASAIGRDGRETPMIRYGSQASDRMSSSTYSTLSEDVEGMADKLNILKLDEVIQHLKSYISEEKEQLIQDLRFLQDCIEEENEAVERASLQHTEPSIAELREERLKLEKDMLSEVFMHQKPIAPTLTTSPHMKPASAKTRISVIPKNAPMKGIHTQAADGVVLSGNVPDSVVIKAQQRLLNEAKEYRQAERNSTIKPTIVRVGSLSANQLPRMIKEAKVIETPVDMPSSAQRPSSALKFRSMVMNTRSVGDNSS